MAAIGRADTLSHARLAKDPEDRDALFALTLTSSLQADYVAFIEKRNLASLQFTKEASASAQELLAVCHDRYGALLATGFQRIQHWKHGRSVALDSSDGWASV